MQIHELNTKALTDPAYVAFDDGTDTYKADFKEVIDDAVADAFSSADVSGGVVNYTSGDSSSPTAWADVSVMASGSTLATLMNRISTMVKNVRYIWSKIGTTDISGIGGGTLTGAVSTLNENVMSSSAGVITSTMASGTVRDAYVVKSGRNLNMLFFVTDTSVPATGNIATLPGGYRPQGARYLMGEVIVNGSRIPMRFNVDMNGNIAISYGNVTMTQVEIAGTIPV